MSCLIKNGYVIDPANKLDGIIDIYIKEGKIASIGKGLNVESKDVLDARNKIVIPGLVDMHVHLREPGREDEETIQTGTTAAVKGGVTSVLAMANTQPVMDSCIAVKNLQNRIKQDAKCSVFIAGNITKGMNGKEVVDFQELKQAGVIAVTDDGLSVDSDAVMYKALSNAKEIGMLVICHCEDKKLSGEGVINLGFISTKLGLKGIPADSEYKRIKRDIELADKTGCHIHIAHVSCKESVMLLKEAKMRGIRVTAETAPHYFNLTEEELCWFNTNMKINPPLRSIEDVEAIKAGICDGTIDVIASDHAPHTDNEKEMEFDYAPFGTIGLETSLAAAVSELIHKKLLNWSTLVKLMVQNPAEILAIDKGMIAEGKDADLVIIDPNYEWVVKKECIVSKSKNSAFLGRELKGLVDYTLYAGEIVFRR